MAGVSPTGFDPKTYDELVEEITTRAKTEDFFGLNFPTTPDSVFGIHTGVLSGSFVSLWNLGQSVANQQNRDTAEGVYLDYLAGLIGLSRLLAVGSTGTLLFSGRQNASIPAQFVVADNQSRNVLTNDDLVLNRAGCYQSTFGVAIVTPLEDYTLVIESDTYTYTASSEPTEEEILIGLVDLIGTQSTYNATQVENTVVVTYNSNNNILTTTNSSTLDLLSIGSLISATSALVGDLEYPADTITTLISPNLDIDSVTNPSTFIVGRLTETDEELRIRMSEREQSTGTATKPSIETAIASISGVTCVFVTENESLVTDSRGIPPKSYETLVSGGNENDIAQVVWETKPAGIGTFGSISKVVIDKNGDQQTVNFSRKDQRFAWMRVAYTINNEEVFPSDGESAMRASVVAEGDDMYDGEDYEPTKFYGALYTTSGMYVTQIEIAMTEDPLDTPVYQTTMIPIERTEQLNFDVSRVELTTI